MPDFNAAFGFPVSAPASGWSPRERAPDDAAGPVFRRELARADKPEAAPERRPTIERKPTDERATDAHLPARGDAGDRSETTEATSEDELATPDHDAAIVNREIEARDRATKAAGTPGTSEALERDPLSSGQVIAPEIKAAGAMPMAFDMPIASDMPVPPTIGEAAAATATIMPAPPAPARPGEADTAAPRLGVRSPLAGAAAPTLPNGPSASQMAPETPADATTPAMPASDTAKFAAMDVPPAPHLPQPADAAATSAEQQLAPWPTALGMAPAVPAAIGAPTQISIPSAPVAASDDLKKAMPAVAELDALPTKAAGSIVPAAFAGAVHANAPTRPGGPNAPAIAETRAPAAAANPAKGEASFKAELAARAEPGGPPATTSTTAPAVGGAPATAPGPPATHQTQISPARIPADALAYEIKRQHADGVNRFEIRLDPPELGRIEVRLEVAGDGAARAHLSAERPETLDLLQRDARTLERALNAAGLKTDRDGIAFSLRQDGGPEFGFGQRETSQNGRNTQSAQSLISLTDGDDLAPANTIEQSSRYSTMRINIVI